MTDQGNVKIDVLVEWFLIQMKMEQLQDFVMQNFNGTLLENY